MHVLPVLATLALTASAPPPAPPPAPGSTAPASTSPAPAPRETLPPPFDTLEQTPITARGFEGRISIFAQRGALKRLDCGDAPCFKVVLEKGAAPLCLLFDDGPSADPSFNLYALELCTASFNWPEPLWSMGATRIVLPGNGALYTAGHTNNLFNTRRKFEVKGRTVTEVKQPFFYVGRVVKLERQPWHADDEPLSPLVLRADKSDKAPVVATLTEGAEAEVLLAEGGESRWFLVRTSLGLVGWYQTPSTGIMPDALGIYYAGD